MAPTDDITVYYSVEPSTSEIARVAVEQKDEIEAILKKPFVPLSNLLNKQRNNIVITKKLPVSFSLFLINKLILFLLDKRC